MIDEETTTEKGFSISWIARLESDSRLLSTHISILSGIYVCWQYNRFQEPFSVTRRKLMAFSKVASIATYHKCIRELISFGYIKYHPSFHPSKGSLVWWSEPK